MSEARYGASEEDVRRIAELGNVEHVLADMSEARYGASEEDVRRIAELGNVEHVLEVLDDEFDTVIVEGDPIDVKDLLAQMADAAFFGGGDAFAEFVGENKRKIWRAARDVPEVVEMLVLGYKLGVSAESGACMNDLGALYYMGDLVDQDYQKAADLYEMAADHGCYQSIINLGYVYEYGRTGERDYAKAFQWYSLAASLAPSSEAVCKLGDMFGSGKFVLCDKKKAYRLYERSLELACTDVELAQPAVRIAGMLIDPRGALYGVELDPMRALSLYQVAEIGLRKDIADGMTYYAKRLQEAIEGQEKARAMLDHCMLDDDDSALFDGILCVDGEDAGDAIDGKAREDDGDILF